MRKLAVVCAFAMFFLLWAAQLAGWRMHAGVLAGIAPSSAAVAAGLCYVVAWFAAVVVAPMLLLGVLLEGIFRRLFVPIPTSSQNR